ncbi:MAG: acetolactate synthase small subunit [Planctomycetes bacterium]|nr:acetolactate synthase small subunit [Planctomycetota bacterium]
MSTTIARGSQFELDPGKPVRRHPVTEEVIQPLHTISLLVRNKPGVLVRVSLIFSRRGYNIESLVVCPAVSAPGSSEISGEFSRMTITCSGEPDTLEQIIKQLEKLIDVVHALDHTGQSVIESELALIKVKVGLKERTEILQVADHYHAKAVDYSADSMILRVEGETDKIDAVIALLKPFNIVELVRSGKILMVRGLETT